MPIRKSSFDKIQTLIFKKVKKNIYNNMTLSLATHETPGFKYLLFFKNEKHSEIAQLLKAGPTVYDVVTLAFQNVNRDIFYDGKVILYIK
jgi:hypothetical protein